MPQGRYPVEFFSEPSAKAPIERIYVRLDEFSMEYFADEAEFRERLDVFVVMPPVLYERQFVKGVLFSQGVDYLYQLHPQIGRLFHTIANSQWCNFPWSRQADGYFSLYANGLRDEWFRRTYPERADKVLIPAQDADYTHDYGMAPAPFVPRDCDVVCVSRMHDLKNLPMIAAALKIFRQKYRPIRMTLVVGKKFDAEFRGLDEHERQELAKIEAILGQPRDYIEFVPQADYVRELPGYYSRAKVCVLGALLEGKNRAIFEALSCNTPVVCFRQFNHYVRGDAPAFPVGGGLYAPEFDAESLADTLHEAIGNHGDFHPRRRFLEQSGRKNVFNLCLDSFPYYEHALPDYQRGRHVQNLWLDLAIQDNYQLSLLDFIFDRNHLVSRVQGLNNIAKMFDFYFRRFGLQT